VLDEIARQIGWAVIGCVIFYAIGKIVISHGETLARKKEMILATVDHQRRLAYRKIWRSTKDTNVINQVKMQYSQWAYLYVDLNDEEYDSKMRGEWDSQAYLAALENVEKEGLPYILENGKIIATFTKEYKSRSRSKQELV